MTLDDTLSELDLKSEVTMNNLTLMMDQNPEWCDGSNLHSQFHSVWQSSLDSPIELPLHYSNACAFTIERLPKLVAHGLYHEGLPDVKNVVELLHMEKDTWTLMSALYTDRMETEMRGEEEPPTNFNQIHHSESEIVKLLYDRDNELRELQMLIDWLEGRVREHIEEFGEQYECLFNQTTTWENTAFSLAHMSATELKASGLPTVLHPDAIYSSANIKLDPKDQADLDRYLNYLFLCIRGGDIQRAQRLCIQRGEYWRAISLEGWRPFHCSSFVCPELIDQTERNNIDGDGDQIQSSVTKWNRSHVMKVDPTTSGGVQSTRSIVVDGNPTRILYKTICWWNGENIHLRPYEKAIYAVLSGNLNALTKVLPCSWNDLTWAHCRAMVEARVDSKLRAFLHTGPRADTLAVTGKSTQTWPLDAGLSLPQSAWLAKDWTVVELFDKIESCLGWSALDQLYATNPLPAESVRRSAMDDFLHTTISAPITTSTRGLISNEPALSVLLYCIFYATQQALILRDYAAYLTGVANVIPRLVISAVGRADTAQDGSLKPPTLVPNSSLQNPIVCHVLRFLAHFVLFLRAIEPDLPITPCAEIIKGHLSVLIVDRQMRFLADYTSTLPTTNLQVQWYAHFLSAINEPDDRELGLSLAVSAGFDIQQLTRYIVHILVERHSSGSSDYSSLSTALFDTKEKVSLATVLEQDLPIHRLSEADRSRLSCLEWLFQDPRQRGEALVVTNNLIRMFIAMNCFKAADQLLTKLPLGTLERAKTICQNSGSPLWLVNAIREYECLLMYLESQDAYADWFTQQHSNRPVQPATLQSSRATNVYGTRNFTERLQAEELEKNYQARLERWRHLVRLDTQTAADKLLTILTYPSPGWLVDVEVRISDAHQDHSDETLPSQFSNTADDLLSIGDDPQARLKQMQVLRENCVTNTVFLLVQIYQTAGMHRECVELMNLVASEDHNLNKLFSRVQLRQLLDHINESIKHLVSDVGDPLGYPIGSHDSELSASPV